MTSYVLTIRSNSLSTKRGIIPQFSVTRRASKSKLLSVMMWLFCFPIGLYLTAQPLDIGNRRQVFIDGRFLAESQGVELIVHQPQKTGELTIKPEYAWEVGGIGPYSAVMKVDETYHIWYHAMATTQCDAGNESGAICYAQSRDGIHWEKPVLGLVEFAGNRENNIVLGHGAADVQLGQDGGMVFIDPNTYEDQKFNLVLNNKGCGKRCAHLFLHGQYPLEVNSSLRSRSTDREEQSPLGLSECNIMGQPDQ